MSRSPEKAAEPATFGAYVRTKRKGAHLSLEEVAHKAQLSHQYLSQVERDVGPAMRREHWSALVAAIPGLTIAELERFAARTRPLEIDLTEAPTDYVELAVAVAERVRNRDLAADELAALVGLASRGALARVRAHGRVVDAAGNPVSGTAYLYRVAATRGWVGIVGARAHAGRIAGPLDGSIAVLTDHRVALLGGKDPRGAGFFDVPGGLTPGVYALDVHAAGGGESAWAWPLVVSDGVGAQDVRIGGPSAAPSGSGSGTSQGPALPANLPPVTPLAKQFTPGTFTASFSYYGLGGAPLERIRRDLDRIRAAGSGNVRVWVDWERPSEASRIVDRKGKLIAAQAKKLDAALDYAATLGVSFDLTLETAHYDAVKKSAEGYDITSHKNAVRSVLERWGAHPAVRIIDLDNEAEVRGAGGHGSPDTGHTSPARFADLMGVARSAARTCLVGASCSFSIDGMPKDYVNLFRDTKGEILLPHFARVKGWGAAEGPNAKALAKALPGILIHHQEPARNGHSTSPAEGWEAGEFEASFKSARAAGSVGCCFHTDAAFDLTQKDAWDQLDATERQVVAKLAEWIR
ncbi:MAG: helix-turn-helix transcriptional regulator [Deltaproteobacteria bacterium]|nr:helix-turn-helix transcriptional regulator [Deltaproteobacteria bacterium]